MNKDPITLKSGATLTLSLASFEDGDRLLQVVARELTAVKFDMNLASLEDLTSGDINTLKSALFQLLQSTALRSALSDCMKKCLYNGERIVYPKTFEPEEARQDFLPVAVEVLKANLRPTFAGLSLSLLTNGAPTSDAPKSEST